MFRTYIYIYIILGRSSHVDVVKAKNKEKLTEQEAAHVRIDGDAKQKVIKIYYYIAVARCTVAFHSRSTITFSSSRRDCRSGYALHRQNTENQGDAIAKVGNKYQRDILPYHS